MSSDNLRKDNFLFVLFISVILANFLIFVSILIAREYGWSFAVLNSTLLFTALVFMAFYTRKWFLLIALITGLTGAVICSMYSADYTDLQKGEIYYNADINNIKEYKDFSALVLTDCRVDTSRAFVYEKRRVTHNARISKTRYYAAPLINKSGDNKHKVSLFAVTEVFSETRLWEGDIRGCIRAPVSFRDEYREAVSMCIEKYSINHDIDYACVKIVTDPVKALKAGYKEMKSATLIFNILLIVLLSVQRIIIYFKKKDSGDMCRSDISDPLSRRADIKKSVIISAGYLILHTVIISVFFADINHESVFILMVLLVCALFFIISLSVVLMSLYKLRHGLIYTVIYLLIPTLLSYYSVKFSDKIFENITVFTGFFFIFTITTGFLSGVVFSYSGHKLTGRCENKHPLKQNNYLMFKSISFLFLIFLYLSLLYTVFLIYSELLAYIMNMDNLSITALTLILVSVIICVCKFSSVNKRE